ncbi:hypothetical protein FDECE_14224 [Fusarium decemcellulare]|nr:hypothetical protein FDECE_14224 [Fusarium decemcellulare]
MDPVLRSPDLPDRAASAEASSTRPNPFDDGDISSRKRRRTSLSGSPANSLDTVNPVHDSSSSTTLDTDPVLLSRSSAAGLGLDLVAPKTPEPGRSAVREPATEPPSSMVTINLRKAPRSDSSTSSPPSPTPAAQTGGTNNVAADDDDDVKASVEDSEVDMVPAPPAQSFDTPQSTSTTRSTSPPIEIITVQSDEDMISERQSVGVSIVGEDLVLIDPVQDFPFNEPEDTLVVTVNRLTTYISSQTPIDQSIIDKLQQWLDQYLTYIKDVDQQSASDSYRRNRSFWSTFPEIINCMACRKPLSSEAVGLRSITMKLFASFAKLTAWFVTLDLITVQESSQAQAIQNQRTPVLIAPVYLQQLHLLTPSQLYKEPDSRTELSSPFLDDVSCFIKEFQQSQGGSLRSLLQLARGVVNLVPTFPRLTDELAPICQIASDIMTDAVFNLSLPECSSTAKQRLEIGYELFDLASDTLERMIEKHPTQLTTDNVSTSARALAIMIKMGLQGHHQAATRLIQDHREAYPKLPPNYTIEAISWEWRFSILIKLIRSSQMQLRVLGVTQMCSDLVSCWRRHCEGGGVGDDESAAHLNHLAEFLLQTGLIEYILGSNCHPEITLEGANIIGFLVVTKMYREEHVNLVWQGITSGQDPRAADALTRMVASISNLFDYNGLLFFCEKFQELPVEGFTPAIRLLWENVMRHMVSRSGADRQVLTFHPYSLCLRLLRESSVCASGSQVANPDMQHAAMQKFKDLLAYGPDPDGRKRLYLSCIEDIAEKSATTLGSLWCLYMAIRQHLGQELHVLTADHDLTRLIVDELEHAIGAARSAGVQTVLWGGINQPRRDFILNIIQLEPQTITTELGPRLWDMLVGARSLSLEDRRAGWGILNTLNHRINLVNPFLQTCLSQYLPTLPSAYFCDGMLEFLRAEILPRVNDKADLALDDQDMVSASGLEQLWRLVLEAEDGGLVDLSVRTLAGDIYIESRHIATNSLQRTRLIHLALVNRCLQQLKDAARRIKASNEGTMSGDDEPMVIVTTEAQTQQQERIFTRSLKLLRYILEAHQAEPRLSKPDLRTLIPQTPYEVQGDSAELKYQSFDGDQQTEVKPLVIGKLNTAASLLASLRQETGFENYRVYYRGQPFLPNENDICRSLADLRVHDGLILVKREDAGPAPPARVKPGASPLEVEISAHFDEMWEYLSMEEALAQEIYHFLVKLPTDGHLLRSIDSEATSYRDVFPPGQPFKSLYAVHALIEYTEAALHGRINGDEGLNDVSSGPNSRSTAYAKALKTSMSFVVQAISDESVFDRASVGLRLRLTGTLIHAFRRFLDRINTPRGSATSGELDVPEPARLVEILSHATACPGETPCAVITGTLAVTLRLSMLDGKFWAKLSTNPDFAPVLHCLLLTDPRNSVRGNAAKLIEDLFTVMDRPSSVDRAGDWFSGNLDNTPLAQYFWLIVSDLVLETAGYPNQCDEFFRLAHFLLMRINTRSPELLDIPKLVSQISQLLLAHTSTETIGSAGPEDSFAKGLASLLHLCLQLNSSVAQSTTLPPDLPLSLFWKQLYPTKRSESEEPVPRVVLHSETRLKLCDVIFNLVKHDKDKMRAVLEAIDGLVPFYEDDDGMPSAVPTLPLLTSKSDDPYLYELPFQFERLKALRAPCGYVGLQNLSNTCYLNSLLTQLYMNTGFRRFMLNSRVRDPANSQQLLFYTQKLFGHMQESYRRFVDPSNVVSSIKTYDDTLIDIHNQMDVDEFYNLLFDRWEGQLLGHDEKRELKSFYGGQLVQQVKSKECEHISERLEPFSAIQCDIKGKNTLEDSLQAYVDGEIMEGDNKYKCSTCDRHVDAVKRACLKDIPDNVIFHLKRFDFNLRTLQRSKINDYFSFPAQVNLRPYTIEHLSNPENDTEEDIFELVGVLVHSGTAESGHYYSYIRERPSSTSRQTWVEFNDDMVTPWDPAHLESSTFGGPDHRPPYDTNGILYDKTYSAYMLFYQRASSLRAEQESMMDLGIPGPLRVEVGDDLKDHIMDENTVILRRHCIYDPSHLRLVQMLFHQTRQLCSGASEVDTSQRIEEFLAKRSEEHGLQDLAMQVFVSHLDQVVTRAKDMPDFALFSRMIGEALASCHNCAFSFYLYFDQRREALRALLQRNPDLGVRNSTSKMFILAVSKIANSLPHIYDPPAVDSPTSDADGDENIVGHTVDRHSVIFGVMRIFGHLWKYFHVHIRAWDEYFGTILGFAKLGVREVSYVLAGDYLANVLRIISADPLQELTGNYARMLHNVLRRITNTRPPSYVSIIALVHYLLGQLEPELGNEAIVEEPTERLERKAIPFSWTSNEVQLVHGGLDDSSSSLFVEKLLGLDQAPGHTDEIIRFLAGMGPVMDTRVLNTLERCIRGDTSTQAMDPFLRAASVYIQSTEQLECATKMVHHVHLQAKSLQNTEGVFFVRFFKTALNLKRSEEGFASTVRSLSLRLVPKWVPYLLAYPEHSVRVTTEDFLERELFQFLPEDNSQVENDQDDQDDIKQTTKQVGLMCLAYLQEHYVRRRAHLSRDIAGLFLQVVGQCARAVDADPETQSELDTEFLAMQREVVEPLRRLIVDDMEEDGSGMLQSFSDSDTITADLR